MRRNAGLLLAARVASAAATVIVLALVSHLRGPDALGAVGIGFALGAIGASVANAGTAALLVREMARRVEDGPGLLGGALAIRLVSIPAALGMAWLAAVVVTPDAVVVVVLAAAGLVAQQLADLTRSVFIARQEMAIVSVHGTLENVVWLAVIAAALLANLSLELTLLLGLLVLIASFGVGLVVVRRLAGFRPRRPSRPELSRLVILAVPFAGFSIVEMANNRIDPLLIGLLVTGPALATAGSFYAAARLIAAFEYLPDAVSRAIYPELSRRVVSPDTDPVPILGQAVSVLLVVGAAVPAVLIPAGGWVMGVVFGEQARRDGWVLGGLALAVPIRSLAYIFGVTLTSADGQTRRLMAASVALVVVVAIDVAGIPLVGLLAPVVAVFVAAAMVFAIYATFVQRRFGGTGIRPIFLVAYLCAAAVAACAGLAVQVVAPEPVGGLVAAALYAVLVWVGPWGAALRATLNRSKPA